MCRIGKKTLICTLENYEDLKGVIVFFLFKISIVGIGNWSFWSYLKLDVKPSATHCKGSHTITVIVNIKKN